MSGKEALSVVVRTDLEQLDNLLEVYHKQFFEDSYRTNFEWVDQIRPVTDSALESELTDALVKLIRNRTASDRCWLAVPDIIEWSRVNGFYFNQKPRSLKHHDLDLQTFLSEAFSDLKDVSEDRLKNRTIYCMDTDDQLIKRWSAFNCLYCEIDRKRHSYVLNAGKWYMLNKDFVKRVNDSFEKMPRYSGTFIEYDDETETIYNKRLVTESGGKYHLLDRDLTHRGGKMEFCDVFSKSKELIHIKRQGGSSTLSHLFYQGTASAEFFLTDPEYRKLIWDKLPKEFQIFKSDSTPKSEEFHVVFGIITDKTQLRLPFSLVSASGMPSVGSRDFATRSLWPGSEWRRPAAN